MPQRVGLTTIKTYPFLDPRSKSVSFESLCQALRTAKPRSIIVLSSSSYNPAGIEPTKEQWKAIAKIIKENSLIAVFDCPAQGVVSGDLQKDIISIQTFIEEGTQSIICQNMANNLGVYSETFGALHIICKSKKVADSVLDQIK